MGSPMLFSCSVENGIDTHFYFGLEAPEPVRPGCPDKVPAYLVTDPAYLNGEEEDDDDEEQGRRRSGGGDNRNFSVFAAESQSSAPGAQDECVSAENEAQRLHFLPDVPPIYRLCPNLDPYGAHLWQNRPVA